MVLFIHNVTKIKWGAHKNGDIDKRCKRNDCDWGFVCVRQLTAMWVLVSLLLCEHLHRIIYNALVAIEKSQIT